MRTASLSSAVFLSALLTSSCAAPHRVTTPAPEPHLRPVLSGEWRVTLAESDGVELDFVMTFSTDRAGRWAGHSRAGGARELAGTAASVLGRLSGELPEGALIHTTGQLRAAGGDTVHMDGILESPFMGRRLWRGYVAGGRMQSELSRDGGAVAGRVTAVPHSSPGPLRDYPALAVALVGAIRGTIFDPALLEREEYRRFFQELHARFARARDDLDAVASFQALKPSLGISHLEFIRNPRIAATPLDSIIAGASGADPSRFVRLSFPAPGVAFLRVTRWDRVHDAVGAAFVRIDSAGAPFLILDIRGNPGGDASAVAPLRHLVRDTVPVGAFAGRRWYAANGGPPRPQDFGRIPRLPSTGAPADLIRALREHGAVLGVAVPREPRYAGTVFLLTDRGTASASEPLAHALKEWGLATLIGERTAGAMLTALPQPLGDGWIAVVPEADYVPADGVRLEGRGVQPHVAVASNEVFLAVADRIAANAPFSAEVLRGSSYEALQRPQDAERAYRHALQAVDAQRPPPPPASRAAVHRHLARILTARRQEQRAAEHWREVLRHLPDDKEALAAVRGVRPGGTGRGPE